MLSKSNSLFIATLLCLGIGAPAHSDENWQLKSSRNDIDTFVRAVDGSKYVAAQHVTTIPSSIEKLVSALSGGEGCKPWLSICISAKIIEHVDDNEYLGYAVIDMPWPLSNRDLVYRSRKIEDLTTGVVEIVQTAEPDSYPPSEWVRMISENTYRLEPLDGGKVKFTWTVHSNPGGNVPSKLVNTKIHKTTRKDLMSLLTYLSNHD